MGYERAQLHQLPAKKHVIAIDGPSGSGKGTLGRMLASHFGFAYLDTGRLYRALAYVAQSGVDTDRLSNSDFLYTIRDINDEMLRSEEMGAMASSLAKNTQVRSKISDIIREFSISPGNEYAGSVIDGRDIGTVVIPDALCKIFLTASLEVRVARRLKTAKIVDSTLTFEEIYKKMRNRDKQDSSRDIAPMYCDESYIVFDTSSKSIDDSFTALAGIIDTKLRSIRD